MKIILEIYFKKYLRLSKASDLQILLFVRIIISQNRLEIKYDYTPKIFKSYQPSFKKKIEKLK